MVGGLWFRSWLSEKIGFISATIIPSVAIQSFRCPGMAIRVLPMCLEYLHCLLLMDDDTVIFASSRDKLEEKLRALKRCTDLLGLVIHPNKSKFISVIANDTEPVKIDDVSINFTTEYTYLETKISNSTCAAQARSHVSSKANHILKFNSFLSKNSDAPYSVKKTVMNSAVKSALVYSSES